MNPAELPSLFTQYRDVALFVLLTLAVVALWWRLERSIAGHVEDLRTTIKENTASNNRLGDLIESQTDSLERARQEAVISRTTRRA